MKLFITLERDQTGYYVAEVPALPGCFSQGRTKAEAKANIQEAIAGWISVMNSRTKKKSHGQKIVKQAGLTAEEFNDL